jgi:hypothetical protein
MKYLIQIWCNPQNWEHPLFLKDPEFLALPEERRNELVAADRALYDEITASGELLVGCALADPVTATTIRGRDGVATTTDGPFPESKEQLAGYFVVECETRERAVEIALRFPDALLSSTAVEVRPIMGESGQEM